MYFIEVEIPKVIFWAGLCSPHICFSVEAIENLFGFVLSESFGESNISLFQSTVMDTEIQNDYTIGPYSAVKIW